MPDCDHDAAADTALDELVRSRRLLQRQNGRDVDRGSVSAEE
jgi:hypothetical protein